MSSICFRIASMGWLLGCRYQAIIDHWQRGWVLLEFLHFRSSIRCGHPSRTYRFTSEMTGSLLVESFSWFLLYGCSCELMVLMVQTVSTSLSPSSPSKDKSGPAVAVSVFEAFAMGRSVLSLYRWKSTAPTPASEASHEIPTGQLGSKCARTVLSVSICFSFLKASSCGWCHFHLVFFSVRW